jgi:hypothetical protein
MYSAHGCTDMTRYGFPHSDIHGSTLACSSPWLFAASHVLHRLLAPRHPPNALTSLTTISFWPRVFPLASRRQGAKSFSSPSQAPAASRQLGASYPRRSLSDVAPVSFWCLSRFVLLFSCHEHREPQKQSYQCLALTSGPGKI